LDGLVGSFKMRQFAFLTVLILKAAVRQSDPGNGNPVGEGVSELRADYGSRYRVYFAQRA